MLDTSIKLAQGESFWKKAVIANARARKKFPQAAYVAMSNFLQMEWQIVHRIGRSAWKFSTELKRQ